MCGLSVNNSSETSCEFVDRKSSEFKRYCVVTNINFLPTMSVNNHEKKSWELMKWSLRQRAKKVVSDSPGLVGFAIGLVNSVINCEESKLQRNCEINLLIKTFLGLVGMMFGLVNVSFSLPEWQAVKVTFFAPCWGEMLWSFNKFFIRLEHWRVDIEAGWKG